MLSTYFVLGRRAGKKTGNRFTPVFHVFNGYFIKDLLCDAWQGYTMGEMPIWPLLTSSLKGVVRYSRERLMVLGNRKEGHPR